MQSEDDDIREKLETIQLHNNPDMKKTVSDERVDNIASLVRGSCTGTLCPEGGCVGGDDSVDNGGDNSGDNSGGETDNSGGDTDNSGGDTSENEDVTDGGDGSSVKVGAGALTLSVLLSMMFV